MRNWLHHTVTRRIALLIAIVCLALWQAPPAVAFRRHADSRRRTTKLTPEQRAAQTARERQQREPDVRALSADEMATLEGRGSHRNPGFSGTMPWQKSFRDVNLNTGNLFKSFTDIQVQAARGAGLAFQRTYNSNDDRVGPFGVGWTHAYDIRIAEAGDNQVPRTDFFGGQHTYTRDADGLYTPPPYLFDELSSEYDAFLTSGPAAVLSDSDKGMDGTVKHFFQNGGERACDTITDRHGNQTVLTYGTSVTVGGVSKALLTRVTDPSGRYLDITWSNIGTTMSPAYRITQVQGPYDASSNPIYVVTYEYNSDGNLWKVHQDPSGLNRTTTYTYTSCAGEDGLLASVSDGLGHSVSYTYSDTDNLSNPNYSGTVWVSTVTEPSSGGTVTWTITLLDGPNHAPDTVWAVDVHDGTLGSNLVDFAVETDNHLRVVEMGVGTPSWPSYAHTWNWDGDNNLVGKHGLVRRPTSDGSNVQVACTFTAATYGPHGNVLTQWTDPYTSTTTTTTYYDASKYFQKASVTDANGHTTTMDYFADDDPSPGNRGEVKWVRDARYGTTGAEFDYTYNTYGQKLTETNLNGVETDYTYGDAWGNLTEVVQDPGTGHLNRTTYMTYDAAGRVVSSTDPMSQTSTFTFNGVGQPSETDFPDESVTYTYGANGRTTSVTDGRGATTIAYETGNDRVASVTDPVTGTVSYTYNLTGQRATLGLPGGDTWSYAYRSGWQVCTEDPDKVAPMLQSVTDDQGRTVEYWFDTWGRLYESVGNVSYASGSPAAYLHTGYTFDSGSGYRQRGLLQEVQNTWNVATMGGWTSTVLVQNDYSYDNAGNRTENDLSDSSGPLRSELYGYDELNRLTSVDYGDGETQSYTFDNMGNRLSKSDTTTSTVSESYTYNNANMLLTRGSNSYTNDADGNTLTGGGRTNTWDGENRLTQCVFGSVTTTHTYGADGYRHQTVNGSNTTDFLLDGDNAVRTNLNGTVNKTYLHGARGPEYERVGTGDPDWYLYDGLGSVLGTVSPAGVVTHTRKYDVYGAVRGSAGGSGTDHKWNGALGHPSEDATGLVYMRGRYYDPATGRFASEDPAAHGNNWYLYCDDSPTDRADASGKDWKDIAVEIIVRGLWTWLGRPEFNGVFDPSANALSKLRRILKVIERSLKPLDAQAEAGLIESNGGESNLDPTEALKADGSVRAGNALAGKAVLSFSKEQILEIIQIITEDAFNG